MSGDEATITKRHVMLWVICKLTARDHSMQRGWFVGLRCRSSTPCLAEFCWELCEEKNGEGKGSPYSITERRVPELITVLDSQPAGEW